MDTANPSFTRDILKRWRFYLVVAFAGGLLPFLMVRKQQADENACRAEFAAIETQSADVIEQLDPLNGREGCEHVLIVDELIERYQARFLAAIHRAEAKPEMVIAAVNRHREVVAAARRAQDRHFTNLLMEMDPITQVFAHAHRAQYTGMRVPRQRQVQLGMSGKPATQQVYYFDWVPENFAFDARFSFAQVRLRAQQERDLWSQIVACPHLFRARGNESSISFFETTEEIIADVRVTPDPAVAFLTLTRETAQQLGLAKRRSIDAL